MAEKRDRETEEQRKHNGVRGQRACSQGCARTTPNTNSIKTKEDKGRQRKTGRQEDKEENVPLTPPPPPFHNPTTQYDKTRHGAHYHHTPQHNSVQTAGTTHPHTPRPSTRPPYQQQTGDTNRRQGHSTADRGHQRHCCPHHTMPPTTTTHTPPVTMATPSRWMRGRTNRGYPTTQRPQTDTHPHHTTHHGNKTVHDTTTALTVCTGQARARATPQTGANQQHTPPPFNGAHGQGRTPSALSHLTLSHLTLLTSTQPTINNDHH